MAHIHAYFDRRTRRFNRASRCSYICAEGGVGGGILENLAVAPFEERGHLSRSPNRQRIGSSASEALKSSCRRKSKSTHQASRSSDTRISSRNSRTCFGENIGHSESNSSGRKRRDSEHKHSGRGALSLVRITNGNGSPGFAQNVDCTVSAELARDWSSGALETSEISTTEQSYGHNKATVPRVAAVLHGQRSGDRPSMAVLCSHNEALPANVTGASGQTGSTEVATCEQDDSTCASPPARSSAGLRGESTTATPAVDKPPLSTIRTRSSITGVTWALDRNTSYAPQESSHFSERRHQSRAAGQLNQRDRQGPDGFPDDRWNRQALRIERRLQRRQALVARFDANAELEGAALQARERLDERLRSAAMPKARRSRPREFSLSLSGRSRTSLSPSHADSPTEDRAQSRWHSYTGSAGSYPRRFAGRSRRPSAYCSDDGGYPGSSGITPDGHGDRMVCEDFLWLNLLDRTHESADDSTNRGEPAVPPLDEAAIAKLTKEIEPSAVHARKGPKRLWPFPLIKPLQQSTSGEAKYSQEISEQKMNIGFVQSDCPICLDELAAGDQQVLVPLTCGHKFHEDCIKPWLRQHGQCPYCRVLVKC